MSHIINEKLELIKDDPEKMQAFAEQLREKMAKENKTLQQVIGVKDKTVEELYNVAYNYYNLGKYKEALSLFVFLASLASKNPRYLFGLASTAYQLGYYNDAGIFFFLTLNEDPSHVMATYFLCDVFVKLEQFEEALDGFEHLIHLVKDKPEYQALSERCKLIREGLLSKKKK